MSYMDSQILHLDMSTINPVNLCPRTYGSLDGTGVGLVASTDIVQGVEGGFGTEYNGSNESTGLLGSVLNNLGVSNGRFAISAFIRLNSVASIFPILSDWYENGDNHFLLRYEPGAGVKFYVHDGAPQVATSADLVAGRLYHVLAVADGTTIRVLIDAVPSGTTDTYSSITAGSGAISIGKDGLTSFANGMIDEVMVFDDDLTQLQAADLRANILNGMPSWRLTHPKTFIRHWPLNNHTRDLMNGNDGTWVGTEAYTEGDYERSVGDFNGSSTISVPDSLATRFGLTDFSFSFSLNFGDGIGSNRGLLEKVEGTSFYEVIKSTADKIRFRIRDASSNLATCLSDTAVALGRTYHIICVCPRGETLRIYMDGRLDQDQGDTSGVGDISTTTALTLCDVSAVSEFKGGGSDFKLHSCALTSDEGKELFMMSMN